MSKTRIGMAAASKIGAGAVLLAAASTAFAGETCNGPNPFDPSSDASFHAIFAQKCVASLGGTSSTITTLMGILHGAAEAFGDTAHDRINANGGNGQAFVKSDTIEIGMPAGMIHDWSWWLKPQWQHIASSDDGADFHGNFSSISLGADMAMSDAVTLGLAVNWEDSTFNTDYNDGNAEGEGWGVMPYMIWELGRGYTFDIALGWSDHDYTANRINPIPTNIFTVENDANTDRFQLSANLSQHCDHGKLAYTNRLGLVLVSEDMDYFEETDETKYDSHDYNLGRMLVGTKATYKMGAFEPFGSLHLLWDWDQPDFAVNPDRSGTISGNELIDGKIQGVGVNWGAGVNYRASRHMYTTFEFNAESVRTDFNRYGISANLHWDM